ncbi:MAG: TIGR02147 family protein [Bdellovibrionales bacterium]|nr:TIGR02147 family protein [Bdellovibrionales bacterium]
MSLLEFTNYHDFLEFWLSQRPKAGRGQMLKLAQAIGINPATVTLIFSRKRDFTPEQAADAAEFLGLTELETDYFLNLVMLARAGKPNLRKKLERSRQEILKRAQNLQSRLPPSKELDEHSKAFFYSEWYFSGVRILTALPEFQEADLIAERLKIPRPLVQQVIQFLLEKGLCIKTPEGTLTYGPLSTHIGSGTPLVGRHHANWRQKAIEHLKLQSEDDLFFTSPMALAKKDIPKVREMLMSTIDSVITHVEPSPSEEVACLNIDFFRY